jgi:3-oxoadipate enol-lactonase/4-carboxymuconolactone decarboxylase
VTVPDIRLTPLATGGGGLPFVLGPSLGTRVARVWDQVRPFLADRHPLFGWDLPGHGVSPATTEPFTVDEIAEGVLRAADEAGLGRFAAAGISLGGIVSLALGLNAPDRVTVTTMVCSLPKIGPPDIWAERAASVRASGTPSLVQGSSQRWFAPGFIEASPTVASPLLSDLMDVDDESYSLCVEALAANDLRDLVMPFHLIAGEVDPVIPLDAAEEAVASARSGKLHIIPNASHLAAVEKPAEVAAILLSEVPL